MHPHRGTPCRLPRPRGPISQHLLDRLRGVPGEVGPLPPPEDEPLAGDDTQLALYLLYELHYRGLPHVDDRWEWEPSLLAARRVLEARFETCVRDEVGALPSLADAGGLVDHLQGLLQGDGGPSVSRYCAEEATLGQLREEMVHRSAYQLKEADPHSWVLPRLWGRPKAALVEIQADEYGEGVEKDMHAELFATTMQRVGLDDRYGAYLDHLPGVTLATVNLISFFGLHRRLRGAAIGHLALFEMASVPVMANHSQALRRHGFDEWTRLFYDTHVVADAHHQTVAAEALAGGLVEQDPDLLDDVLFGVHALATLEGAMTGHILGAWREGRTSLLEPLPDLLETPGRAEERAPADDPRDDVTAA